MFLMDADSLHSLRKLRSQVYCIWAWHVAY